MNRVSLNVIYFNQNKTKVLFTFVTFKVNWNVFSGYYDSARFELALCRGAFFAWRAPILSWPRIMCSQVKIFRTVTRNAVNKSVWRKKDCFWLPLNKHAVNIWLSSLRIRAHLSWRKGKHLHVLHVLRTYSTCSYPGYQDTTTYAALHVIHISKTINLTVHLKYLG